jgi:hypothetical protein
MGAERPASIKLQAVQESGGANIITGFDEASVAGTRAGICDQRSTLLSSCDCRQGERVKL